jgi:N-acetylneuraminic acid mutarotase
LSLQGKDSAMKTNHLFCFCFIILTITCFTHKSYSQGLWVKASTQGFTSRSELSASEINGNIYVMGGTSGKGQIGIMNALEVYDASADIWTTPKTIDSLINRYDFSSVVINGKIYILGGTPRKSPFPPLQIFDPTTNTWSTPQVSGAPHMTHAYSTEVINGKIYVLGGFGGNKVDSMDIFDPQNNTWTAIKTIGFHLYRGDLASAVVNGKIYVLGGDSSSNVPLNSVEVFDPSNNTWTSLTTIGGMTPRWGLTASVVGNKIYAIGGNNGFTALNTLEVFDPATNTWIQPTTTGNLTPRYSLASAVVNGKIYVLGGDTSGGVSNLNEIFDPQTNSIKKNPEENKFNVFPNPTNGHIVLKNMPDNIIKIEIDNEIGQKIMELKPSLNLDLTGLQAGIYYLKVQTANSIITQKIIKE